jgi:uncharacterized protein YbjT (DUF2867 family)
MNILLCGADGYIGKHISNSLKKAGHKVKHAVRKIVSHDDIAIDFMHDTSIAIWIPRLKNIDVVINAVGILHEDARSKFNKIHRDTPIALFDACAVCQIKKIIHISALGDSADEISTRFMRSKREADAYLMAMNLDYHILRPSLVVGIDGASSLFFRVLSSMPVIILPGQGTQLLQPVDIDDVCTVVVKLLEPKIVAPRVLDVVGPEAMSYRAMLARYRQLMGIPPALWLTIPMPLLRLCALIAEKLHQHVFTPDTLTMLEENNSADAKEITQLLGQQPRSSATWFSGIPGGLLRAQARASWTQAMLRFSLALVWIITAILSLGIFPLVDSLELLAQVGLHGNWAKSLLWGSAMIDCGMGLATVCAPSRNLWRTQIALILGYSSIIGIYLPAYLIHPFGPILKNIPIIAILLMLASTDNNTNVKACV